MQCCQFKKKIIREIYPIFCNQVVGNTDLKCQVFFREIINLYYHLAMCDCYIKKKHIKSQDIARKIASPPIELYHPMISSKGCSAPAVGSIMTLKILILHKILVQCYQL